MRQPALLFTLLCLSAAAHAADDKALWKAVFQLEDPEQQKSAATLLRSNGAAGYDVLAKVARAGGEHLALSVSAVQVGCHMFGGRISMAGRLEGSQLPLSAVKLATEMLQEDRALRESLLGSEEPFDRALALMVSSSVPGALPGALKRLENEKEARVLSVVEPASRCAAYRTGERVNEDAQRLVRRMEGATPNPRCDQAGFQADALVEGLAKGTYQISGWGRSGDDFTVTMKRGPEQSTHLAPACAIALYDALAKKGKYEPGLVVPLTQQHLLPMSTRDAAARRAVRDLPKFPEANRNRLAADLVNAGYAVPVKVTYQGGDMFAQENELEAAARQGSPQALADIDRFVFCRGTFGAHGLAMLGYVKTPDAAETAYQLAQQCPRALAAGTAALLRLKDPRGLQLLNKALEDTAFAEDDLYRAAIEAYTPALGRELHKLADSKDGFRVKEMIQVLKTAGVMRD
ncbi:hypothetical protein [Hyalangium versicolor]|uniref:hypothetical protein n=1 Tax=Hyalangium versicolor TaxID=2861190 RepID=UPI001CCEEE12|nr:hypothetical protein [Hyalangium versicolor]